MEGWLGWARALTHSTNYLGAHGWVVGLGQGQVCAASSCLLLHVVLHFLFRVLSSCIFLHLLFSGSWLGGWVGLGTSICLSSVASSFASSVACPSYPLYLIACSFCTSIFVCVFFCMSFPSLVSPSIPPSLYVLICFCIFVFALLSISVCMFFVSFCTSLYLCTSLSTLAYGGLVGLGQGTNPQY